MSQGIYIDQILEAEVAKSPRGEPGEVNEKGPFLDWVSFEDRDFGHDVHEKSCHYRYRRERTESLKTKTIEYHIILWTGVGRSMLSSTWFIWVPH